VRLAADLVGGTTGGLYINHLHLKLLELGAVHELPAELIGSRLPYGQDLVSLVAQSGLPQIVNNYSEWPDRSLMFEPYGFKIMIGIPLKQAGEVEAVLFIAESTGERRFGEADIEILVRFAAQASLALQTSQLLSLEQRRLARLAILHKIGDYIQAAQDLNKIVHVVLTGVTAGYGLGFNRAALFLLDERREALTGEMGIGHVHKIEAETDWLGHRERGLEDFGRYLDLLEREGLPITPIGERIQGLQLPLTNEEPDLFSQVIQGRHYSLVTPAELSQLPGEFAAAFEPALPLIVAPLVAGDQAIGLLVADNKVTQSPITPEDIETLLTFANTVAVTIDNVGLFHAANIERERLSSLYEASNALVLSQDPEQVLYDVVERARLAAKASGASMVLIDQMTQPRYLITLGIDEKASMSEALRADGFSMQVMRTGRPEVIEDTAKRRDQVNPTVFGRGIAAALYLPISLDGRHIGVMWIHYNQPHHFSKSEIETLQLYVNQAAIAYDNARRIKELHYLHRAAEALAGLAELQEVLEQIVQSAQEVLEADSAVIWSYDAIRDKFILERSVAAGIPSKVWREFQKVGPRQGGTAYTVMGQGWIGITDVDDGQQYGFIGESTRTLLETIKARSFQAIALIVDEEKLGVLFVNYNHLRSFTDTERGTAQTFANYAALALKKAWLFDQTNKVRNAARIVAGVTVLGNLNRTLHSIVEGTIEVVNCDAVTLYVYNQDKDKLAHPPTTAGVKYPDRTSRLPDVWKDSIVFAMLSQDRPYIVEEIMNDPLFKITRFAVEEGIKSCIALPLQVGSEKVGVMFVNYRQLHHFNHDELTNIELFAHQAAVAIRNAQFYEQLQRRARALQALYEAGQIVTSSLNLEKILFSLAEQAWRLIGTSHCCRLARINGNELVFVAAYPLHQLAELHRVIGSIDLTGSNPIGVTGRAARTGRSKRVGDIDQDLDYIKYDPRTRSELVVPIKVEDQVIGIIDLEHVDYDAFSEEDQRDLEALAAQAAIAIQNATLFEEIQRRAGLLDAAAKVAREATVTLEINELLNETVRLISKHFGFYHVGVLLLDGDRQYAVLRATYPKNNRGMLKRGWQLKVGEQVLLALLQRWVNFILRPMSNKILIIFSTHFYP
jgi:GAF domain-containing protein